MCTPTFTQWPTFTLILTFPLACIHFTLLLTKTFTVVPLRIILPLSRKPTCLLVRLLILHGIPFLFLLLPKTLAFTLAVLGPSQQPSLPRCFSLPVASGRKTIITSSQWSPCRQMQISLRTRSRSIHPAYPPWLTLCWRLIPALTILKNQPCTFLARNLTRDTS